MSEPLETEGQFEQWATESGIIGWLNDGPVEQEETPADDTASERPRDEQGRFVAAQADEPEKTEEPAEEAEEAAGAEEPVAEETDEPEAEADDGDLVIEIDDDLQAVLDKYDGDVGKALKALNESQSMIGRQGNELGDLRRELQEMRQAVEQGFQQQPQQPQFVGPYQNDIDENPQALAVEALERGDGRTLEMALRAWGEYDAFGATTFLLTLQQEAAQAAAQPAPEPTPQAQPGTGNLEQAMSEVVSRHPDVEKYLPQVQQVAEEFPTLRDSMKQGSPGQQAQAFEELLKIAKSRSIEGDTTRAMKKVIFKAQEEVRKEKSDAAVVSATNQTAATRQSNLDAFYEAFDEAAERYTSADWITRSND